MRSGVLFAFSFRHARHFAEHDKGWKRVAQGVYEDFSGQRICIVTDVHHFYGLGHGASVYLGPLWYEHNSAQQIRDCISVAGYQIIEQVGG